MIYPLLMKRQTSLFTHQWPPWLGRYIALGSMTKMKCWYVGTAISSMTGNLNRRVRSSCSVSLEPIPLLLGESPRPQRLRFMLLISWWHGQGNTRSAWTRPTGPRLEGHYRLHGWFRFWLIRRAGCFSATDVLSVELSICQNTGDVL